MKNELQYLERALLSLKTMPIDSYPATILTWWNVYIVVVWMPRYHAFSCVLLCQSTACMYKWNWEGISNYSRRQWAMGTTLKKPSKVGCISFLRISSLRFSQTVVYFWASPFWPLRSEGRTPLLLALCAFNTSVKLSQLCHRQFILQILQRSQILSSPRLNMWDKHCFTVARRDCNFMSVCTIIYS